MTEQEKIEHPAKQARDKREQEFSKSALPSWKEPILQGFEEGFEAGASYYASEVMPGELAKAMEWISLKGLYQEIDGRWYDKFGGEVRVVAETTKDLLVLFEKYKLNQDAAI